MDIISNGKYPSNALSNFAPHPFTLDGVECNSMEGFLQSLKFFNPDMQKHVCSLVGRAAKRKGAKKDWAKKQVLFWQGEVLSRKGDDYQVLLDRAFLELSKNTKFAKALLATGDATLSHSLGKNKQSETVLTTQEFVSRLVKMRALLRQ